MDDHFITRDYLITDGAVVDIVIPANFLGLYMDSQGQILLRAVSDLGMEDWVLRFKFLVLPVGVATQEHIAYSTGRDWDLVGIVGAYTVYSQHLEE